MRFTLEVPVAAPREQVFDYFADPANRPRWQTSIRSLELETEGPPRVGTRWRETARGAGTFAMEISEFERPHRWAERVASPRAEGTVALTFQETQEGALVVVDVVMRLRGLLRIVEPIAAWVLRREMGRDVARGGRLVAEQ